MKTASKILRQRSGNTWFRLLNDVVFKSFFSMDEDLGLLRQFLSDTLKIPLGELVGITIKNPEITLEDVEQRNVILDLLVEVAGGRLIHLEIQVGNHAFFKHRVIYQHARLATGQLKRGDGFELQRQISLVIVDFALHKDVPNPEVFHRQFMWRDDSGVVFDDITEIHTVELGRLPKQSDSEEIAWYELFKARTDEELRELAGRSETMRKAVAHLERVSADENVRRLAEARDYWMRMDNSVKEQGYMDGVADERERANAKAFAEKLEKAKNGFSKGYSIEIIHDLTGLEMTVLRGLQHEL
ncbi:MAG: Rpn family recombination-promoting nuclease/putative transposase [Turicibacter sp.]|nr:Rpn family recombination-promoting nuclease/putative transposase [Turicibacter sp.]